MAAPAASGSRARAESLLGIRTGRITAPNGQGLIVNQGNSQSRTNLDNSPKSLAPERRGHSARGAGDGLGPGQLALELRGLRAERDPFLCR